MIKSFQKINERFQAKLCNFLRNNPRQLLKPLVQLFGDHPNYDDEDDADHVDENDDYDVDSRDGDDDENNDHVHDNNGENHNDDGNCSGESRE